MVKLINFKSELALNSRGSAFKVVRTKYCYLVNKTVGMIKCKVEFFLAGNNYFYFYLLLSSSFHSRETHYNYRHLFCTSHFFLKVFHDSGSPENIFPVINTLCFMFLCLYLSQFRNCNFTNASKNMNSYHFKRFFPIKMCFP